jgi:hypothetical protein
MGVAGPSALALEEQTIGSLALRAQKALSPRSSVEGSLTGRWREGFNAHERGIALLGFNTALGGSGNDLNLSYQVQFWRKDQQGSERRWTQQLRHRFQLAAGTYELSGRLEERSFSNGSSGERLRLLNRWNQPLGTGNTLQFGYEWMYNLNDISAGTQRGLNQNRLILGLLQPLENGNRLEWEYQMSFMHVTAGPRTLQHQLQLRYSFNL